MTSVSSAENDPSVRLIAVPVSQSSGTMRMGRRMVDPRGGLVVLERLVHHVYDGDGDDAVDREIFYSYDDATNTVTTSTDADGDGAIDTISAVMRNEDDLTVLDSLDSDGDGAWDSITQNEYNDQGRLAVVRKDSDGDGAWDSITQNEYDDEGRLTGVRVDSDGDGTWDSSTERMYDAAGNLVLVSSEGTADRYSNTYDDDGFLIEVTVDNGDDGSIEVTKTYTRADDGSILIYQSSTTSSSADTTRTSISTVYYDEAGNRTTSIKSTYTTESGWNSDFTAHSEYDENGVLRCYFQGSISSVWEASDIYHYDDFGNLLYIDEILDLGNLCDQETVQYEETDIYTRVNYTYDCWEL